LVLRSEAVAATSTWKDGSFFERWKYLAETGGIWRNKLEKA
jgi:hypothetical protein